MQTQPSGKMSTVANDDKRSAYALTTNDLIALIIVIPYLSRMDAIQDDE